MNLLDENIIINLMVTWVQILGGPKLSKSFLQLAKPIIPESCVLDIISAKSMCKGPVESRLGQERHIAVQLLIYQAVLAATCKGLNLPGPQ